MVTFRLGDQVIHPVENPQESGLSTTRRTDDGCDSVFMDRQSDVLDRPECIIKDFQVLYSEFLFDVSLSHGSLFTRHPGG